MAPAMQAKLLRALQERTHRAARRRRSRSRSTCASSPPPTATSSARSRRVASAPISTTASTWCRSRCRRCASGAKTSACSRRHSSRARAPRRAAGRGASTRDAGRARALRLARQRARARERDRARRHPDRGRLDRARRSARAKCRSRAAPNRCATKCAPVASISRAPWLRFESELIREALERSDGNQTRAPSSSGSRGALLKLKMDRYGIGGAAATEPFASEPD